MAKVMQTSEALALIKQGSSVEDVVLDDIAQTKLGFRDALLLVEHGFLVPSGNVILKDSDVAYDRDFDDVQWESNYSKLSDLLAKKGLKTKQHIESQTDTQILEPGQETITFEIPVEDKDVKKWLEKNTPKLNALVKKLVVDLYYTDKMLHEK